MQADLSLGQGNPQDLDEDDVLMSPNVQADPSLEQGNPQERVQEQGDFFLASTDQTAVPKVLCRIQHSQASEGTPG